MRPAASLGDEILLGGPPGAVVRGEEALLSITAPGVYRLTRNLVGIAGQSGIEIAASHVTVDLNGFSLIGTHGSGHGIIVTAPCQGLRIASGSIHDWGRSGVGANLAMHSTLNSLRAEGNGLDGLTVGVGSIVRSCAATRNGRDGIKTDTSCIVDRCVATRNGHVKEGGQGIDAGDANLVTSCTAYANRAFGLYVGSGATVRDCTVHDNHAGGIETEPSSVISECTVSRNRGDGIHAGQASRVQSCTVSLNEGDGIEVSTASLVIGNVCAANGTQSGSGAGVRATGFANRIESNHLAMNGHGLVVSKDGNVIIRNSAVLNGAETPSDYNIAEGNTVDRAYKIPPTNPRTTIDTP